GRFFYPDCRCYNSSILMRRPTSMKNVFSRKFIEDLSDRDRDLLLGLFLLLVVAVAYYFQWAYYLTGLEGSKVNIDQPARFFWWANDSRSYRDVGEWLFGRSDITSIDHRPWLYPLLLGLTRTLFGSGAESVMWVLQLLMWLASGALIYLGLQNTVHSTALAMLGAGFFFSHPSPLLLTFHGMTETLNIFVISAFAWVLTTTLKNRIYYAIVLIALATVTKPIYLLFLILLVLYILARYRLNTPPATPVGRSSLLNRKAPALKQPGLILVLLLPIWIQLALTLIAIGRPTLSTIGSYTFKNYLVADVYLRTEGTEWRPTMELIKDWDMRQQLAYLSDNQRMTLLTIRSHLIDSNLLTGSFYALGEGNRMKEFSITWNTAAAYIHLLMLPLVLYYLLSKRYTQNKETIALLYICFVLQFLTSGISTGQEDRLLITALPLWIIAYLAMIHGLWTSPLPGKNASIAAR
ncbi:MAG TPA: hypothetical protein VFY25_03735, partial [Anaerolineales bacterium]|nr:hypothetical protein [Anaerolineales bacterium]